MIFCYYNYLELRFMLKISKSNMMVIGMMINLMVMELNIYRMIVKLFYIIKIIF